MAESKRKVFFRRLSVTIGLWILIAVAVYLAQDWLYAVLIGGAALMALREFYAMVGRQMTNGSMQPIQSMQSIQSTLINSTESIASIESTESPSPRAEGAVSHYQLGLWAAAIYLIASYCWLHNPDASIWFDMAYVAGFIFTVFLWQMRFPATEREPLEAIAYTVFGFLYIPWLFNFVAKIMFMVPREGDGNPAGLYYVLFLLVATKFSDMGAYAFGSLFGRHRFMPHISPKKTWEGFIGAILASLVGAWGVYMFARPTWPCSASPTSPSSPSSSA